MTEEYEFYNPECNLNNYMGDFYNTVFAGGMLEGFTSKKKDLTPEMLFNAELWRSYNILDLYIDENDFNNIKNNLKKFKFLLAKNPVLILISYITIKSSKINNISIGSTIKKIMNDKIISLLIKENNISQYDILRYCRYYQKFIPNLLINIQV